MTASVPASLRARLASAKKSVLVVAVAMAVALAVAGCGSSPTSSASSPSPSTGPTPKLTLSVSPCSLVTASDASSVTGATLASAAGGSPLPNACFYTSTDGKTFVVVVAQVFPDVATAAAVSPQQIAAALSAGSTGSGLTNAKVVSGIGDKAVEYNIASSTSSGLAIFVFKSNVFVMIAVTPSPSSTAIEQLATTAVGRI